MKMTSRGWQFVVVAFTVAACSGVALLNAQEKTPQARVSGAWQFNPAKSSPIPDPSGRSDSQGNKLSGSGGGGQGGSASDPSALPGAKALIQLMEDICEVPRHMALTATPDAINLIDDHGLARRFAPANKAEKIDYGSSKVTFRTHWEGSMLVQDITADSIEITRTFETTPDGEQLTVTLTIMRQPDPKAMAAMGNRGEIRKYVYGRAS